MKFGAGEAIIRSLEIEGTTHVFGLVGSAIMELFELVDRSPQLTYVGARHEDTSAHMAHGYARASGRMSVVLSQNGAGVTNQVTGYATALRANVPLLGIAGVAPSTHTDTGDRHEIDQLGAMRPVTKWAARVARADRIPEYVQRAYRIALTPPLGPVFLEIPGDMFHESLDWDPPESPANYRATYQSMVDRHAVGAVADMLTDAERPVFILGSGGEDETAWRELAAISEREQVPLTATFGHNSAIPPTPLAIGSLARQGSKAAMHVLADADLVVVLGSRLTPNTTIPYYGFKYWPDDARVVQVDSNPLNVGRHRRLDLGIVADCAQFATALREQMESRTPVDRAAWRSRILEAKAEWEAERPSAAVPAVTDDGSYLNPAAVYETVGKVRGGEGLILADVGSTTSWAFRMLDFGQPKGFMYTGPMAGVGFAMPASLGAKLGRPDRPVVAMIGDGGFSLSLPALITAVEHHIPVQIVICDNQAWGAEKAHQMYYYDRHYVGTDLETTDLVDIAQSIGASAVRVDSTDALADALGDEPTEGPQVIVAPTDPDDYPHPTVRHGARKEPPRFVYT